MPALQLARDSLKASGGLQAPVWALIALIATAQKEFAAAHAIINAALETADTSEQLLLLRIQACIHQLHGKSAACVALTICQLQAPS